MEIIPLKLWVSKWSDKGKASKNIQKQYERGFFLKSA